MSFWTAFRASLALRRVGQPAVGASGLPVSVDAGPGATYRATCHGRAFKGPDGLYANTYSIGSRGRFRDLPDAHCVLAKLRGDGPATLHILKHGDQAATVTHTNQWVRLDVWRSGRRRQHQSGPQTRAAVAKAPWTF